MKNKKSSLFLALSSLFLLSACSPGTYTQKIIAINNAGSVNGADNLFSYEEEGDFGYKTPEEIEAENGLNLPDVMRYAPKFTYKTLGENVMPVLGYIEPKISDPAFSKTLEETMSDFAASGCNILNCVNYNIGQSAVTDMMRLAEESGVMMLLKYGGMNTLHEEASAESATQKLYLDLREFYNMKSFAGIHVADEPGYLDWEKYGKSIEYFRSAFNSKLFFINLLPIYSPSWAFPNGALNPAGKEHSTDYQYYYDSYLELANPQVVCYDYYPLIGAFPGLKNQYFYQLALIKEKCEAAKMPFWTFIQVADWGGTRNATYAEIAWQVNTSLALGAKGIQYYTYNYYEGHTNTMIAKNGDKNRSYYDAQTVNRQIAAADEWLLNCNVKAVIQSGITPNGESLPTSLNPVKSWKHVRASSGVAHLIGCMDYYENNVYDPFVSATPEEVYYVCNNTITTDGNVSVEFTEPVRGEYVLGGEKFTFEGDSLTLPLGAGEGAAIRITGVV